MGIRRNIVCKEWGQSVSHTHMERSHLWLIVVRRTWEGTEKGVAIVIEENLLRPRQEQQP